MTTNFGRMNAEKRQAHEILDLVKQGRMVSWQAIENALDALGELDDADDRLVVPAQLLEAA